MSKRSPAESSAAALADRPDPRETVTSVSLAEGLVCTRLNPTKSESQFRSGVQVAVVGEEVIAGGEFR